MDRKAIVAFILIGLIMILWGPYLRWISPPRQKVVPPMRFEERGDGPGLDEEVITSSRGQSERHEPSDRPTLAPVDTSLALREIVVDTDLYRAKLSTQGGTIKSWQLKAFEGIEKRWVELMPQDPTGALSLSFDVGGREIDLSEYSFSCEAQNVILDETHPTQSINMILRLQDGKRVEKEFTFRLGQYSFDLRVLLEGFAGTVPTREYELVWRPGLGSTEVDVKEDMAKMAACALLGDGVAKYDIGRKEQTLDRREDGTTGWGAIRTKYFLMAMIPRSEPAKGIEIQGRKRKVTLGKDSVEMKTFATALRMDLRVDGATSHGYEVYLGPQDYALLRKYGVGLEKCMDLGWPIIRPVSRVILAFFVFAHRYIPNYGLVIIIFSILLKVLFYPLTHKQLEATKKMQQLQPQLATLKEKYKKDPQRLNRETMALYKKHGANPLGGCFPLLLQMPIFFALFTVFRSTIELRRAEFVGWIQDLSQKDPYLVLPIIMAITMFIQQKMTMKDPKQAAMVYLMPVIMFVFLMNFASGLVLYWTVFNILSILQQLFVDRKGRIAVQK